jgi:hypothetical protein
MVIGKKETLSIRIFEELENVGGRRSLETEAVGSPRYRGALHHTVDPALQ